MSLFEKQNFDFFFFKFDLVSSQGWKFNWVGSSISREALTSSYFQFLK